VLIGEIVNAVGLHEAGDAVGSPDHRVSEPWRFPARLPGQTKARLEVSNPLVGVIAETDLRFSGNQVEVYVLTVRRCAPRDHFIAEAEIQRQIVFDAPVILSEEAKKVVPQILVPAPAIPF